MSRGRQWLLVVGISVLAAVLVGVALWRGGGPAAATVGAPAPAFAARTLDTPPGTRTLEDLAGSVVLLNVWATWCIPCQREMPSIERLHREFAGRGLHVVAVSVDDGGAEDDIRQFAAEFGLTFEILHDPTGGIMRTYHMIGVPQSFLIDRAGIIQRATFETDWYSDEHRGLVAALVAESASE